MSEIYIPADEDVVILDPDLSYNGNATSTVIEPKEGLAEAISDEDKSSAWIKEGLKCKILKSSGGGWQPGKIHLRLVFTPDPLRE